MIELDATYDSEANAVYIFLDGPISPGGAVNTYACDPIKVGGMINLDFGADGRLIGIDVLGARGMLPQRVIDQARPI